MKKIIGFFTLTLALFLYAKQSKADITPSSWGTYHNSALAATTNIWIQSTYNNADLMLNMATALGKNNSDFAGISAADISTLMNNPDFNSAIQNSKKTGNDATVYFRSVLDNKMNTGQMSHTLHDIYITIFDANLSYDQIQQNLNAVNISQLPLEDQNHFIAVKSVITNSNTYWTNWIENNVSACPRLNRDQIACLWDGIAGAILFEAGPLGVLGAACVSASALG